MAGWDNTSVGVRFLNKYRYHVNKIDLTTIINKYEIMYYLLMYLFFHIVVQTSKVSKPLQQVGCYVIHSIARAGHQIASEVNLPIIGVTAGFISLNKIKT